MDYRELPEEFLEKMKQFLGEEYPEYLASYEEEPRSGLRVNTGRLTPEQFLEMAQTADWNLKPVPWTKNGFYYQGERPSRHPWYYAGLYYLQEPSAMSPAAWLPIKPGDRVLDLCAAPGGKSTELAAKLAGTGVLFSNDISNSRAKALLKNLEMFGAGNICVTSEAPEKMAGILPEFFDKILVDAPCSGACACSSCRSPKRSLLSATAARRMCSRLLCAAAAPDSRLCRADACAGRETGLFDLYL